MSSISCSENSMRFLFWTRPNYKTGQSPIPDMVGRDLICNPHLLKAGNEI